MNKAFEIYVDSINKQTEALKHAFDKMIEHGFDPTVEGEVARKDSGVMANPTPVIPTNVPSPKTKDYHMSVKLIKDETTYSNMEDMNASTFTPGFGLDDVKRSVVSAGEMEIRPTQDELYRISYPIYKNGVQVGVVHPCRDNKDLIAQLEMYVGEVVKVNTVLKREIQNSIFTSLTAHIIGVSPLNESVEEDDSKEVSEEPASSIDLEFSDLFPVDDVEESNTSPSSSISLGSMDMSLFSPMGSKE